MNEFFGNQIDYILFFYGLAFLMLGVICLHLSRQRGTEMPWIWLGAFGWLHGVQEWAGMLSGGYQGGSSLYSLVVLLSAGSFFALSEFGLRSLPPERRKTVRILFIPLLVLAALGGLKGYQGLDASFRYTLGMTGGLLAAGALRRASGQSVLAGKRWLFYAGVSLALYSVITGTLVHYAEFWPASVLNSGAFYALTGVPAQLIKGVLAVFMAFSVWAYSQSAVREDDALLDPGIRRRNVVMPAVLFIGIIIAGWLVTRFAGEQALSAESRDGNIYISALANHFTSELSSAEQAASGIALEQAVAEALATRSAADVDLAGDVLRQYVRILDAGASTAYLFDTRGRKVVSSDSREDRRFNPEGTRVSALNFRKAADGDFSSFYLVDGPSTDRFHITYYPVRDHSEAVTGVVVIRKSMDDIEASFKKHAYCFLVDPHGVIFLSSRDDLHLKSLWPLSPEDRRQLASSGQFGSGEFLPLMPQPKGDDNFVVLDGEKRLMTQRSLGRDNWSLVLLSPTNHIRAYRLFSIFTTFVFFSMAGVFFAMIYLSRESEARVAASERHYRGLVEGSPNCVALFSEDGRCLSVNRSGILQTGLTEEEIVGRMIYEIWPEQSQQAAALILGNVQKGMRYSYDTERVRRDGRHVMWYAVLNPLYDSGGRISRFVGIFTDITERRKAEAELKRYHEQLEALVEERTREITDANHRLQLEVRERLQAEDARRDSEERFHSLFNLASDCIFLLDPASAEGPVIVDANLAACTMNGYALHELIGKPIAFLDHPDERYRVPDITEQIMAGGTVTFEMRHRRKDGSSFPIEVSARMISLGGRPYILAIDRDITERKLVEEELQRHREQLEQIVEERTAELKTAVQLLTNEINFRKNAEETLKESEAKFRRLSQEFHTLLDAMTDELFLVSPDLTILWANKAFALRVGRDAADLTGEHCHALWFGSDIPCEDCYALKSMKTGLPQNFPFTSASGRIFDRRAFPIKDEEGRVQNIIIVSTDITEKTALQAETMRVGHLASLGELSAGVAHEINNPITGIINYAQLLANKSEEGSREQDIARRIVREGERIAGIVRSLLSFARERREDKTALSVDRILHESITLTEAQIKKDGISLMIDLAEGLPRVVVNPQQIQQVVLNIISNARYALNHKYPETHEDKVIDIAGSEVATDDGTCVRIIFRDRGTGIPAENIGRVINPFFSTKPDGEGTGLGLSISHGIIRDHGGRLRIESREGVFTSVIVELPAWRNDGA